MRWGTQRSPGRYNGIGCIGSSETCLRLTSIHLDHQCFFRVTPWIQRKNLMAHLSIQTDLVCSDDNESQFKQNTLLYSSIVIQHQLLRWLKGTLLMNLHGHIPVCVVLGAENEARNGCWSSVLAWWCLAVLSIKLECMQKCRSLDCCPTNRASLASCVVRSANCPPSLRGGHYQYLISFQADYVVSSIEN